MESLLCLSIAVIAGLLLSRLAKKLQLPAVTAYLIAGILIGPYFLGRLGIEGLGYISTANVKDYSVFCDVALGFIAFDIGNEFRISHLKRIGSQATIVAIIQGCAATLLVDVVLVALHFMMPEQLPMSSAIILGAIAAATAPASTLMVVKQYKAKGPLTDMLLPVVAIDDAVCLIVYALSFGIARALSNGSISLVSILLEPALEVICSLALGAVMGLILTYMEKHFDSNSKRLSIIIAFVMLTVALSMLTFNIGGVHIGFSSLLVCMMCGTVFCNICNFSEDMMGRANKWTAPLYVLFFALSGAELELGIFGNMAIVVIGVIYVLARSGGKIFGANFGCKLTKCDPKVSKYLGVTLLPQEGVALGMSMKAAAAFGEEGQMIRNIILFAVLVYELVGPLMTKIALMKAGEISPRPEIIKQPNIRK